MTSDRPLPPVFTARTDPTAGTVSTRGHLDRLGAEALCRTVTGLHQLGHRRIVVLPGPAATVDDDARTVLTEQARRLRADGIRLVLG